MSFSRLVNDIKTMLDTAEPPSTYDCCIYKVPSDIRTLNENAYTPKFVSIGPFHHGHPHPQIQNMERQKLIYFKDFLQRTETTLNEMVYYIDAILSDFKCCYSETLPFSHDELVKLILIDSGFIIELFCRSYYDVRCINILSIPWLYVGIRSDLMLLENQLPYFVIEKIYSLSLSSTNASVPNTNIPSFLKLTTDYFDYYNKSKLDFDKGDISIRHFTDLIRIFHLQHPIENRPSRDNINKQIIHLPSATELLEAGVRFKVNTESKCLLDLRFSGGVLEIPQLIAHDGTEIMFRNMVALEQCRYPYESYITDYVAVLDYLINTGKDVDILVQNKILENMLGDSDSVANLFNGLSKYVIHSNISLQFSILCKDLNAFCGNPWRQLMLTLKLKSTLMRDYCSTPWQAAASFAGILLLVLTLIQTVCSCK
ncbi:hypothetical protein MtrunA17_Chr6g0452561 [Medicago truncatula]|uniref:DUF247 domain protein n=1 Tax=Medicago truncatula TaxID=3880 RepID=G7KKF8_MEDTR|nr:UPF0481 protein At3g47200 [Medicago truncatula]AES74687.1 DUF247 domain protein [Medicago truncatula]RHN49985.1 hypothetical protein MtrunA17_Chr6g0452561 [Medicago truncatula]